LLADPKLSVRMYTACATALARIEGKQVSEQSLADYFAKRLEDDSTSPALRAQLLKQVPATHPKMTIPLLAKLSTSKDDALQLEAVRALLDHPDLKRATPLVHAFRDSNRPLPTRAFALLGLSGQPEALNDEFLEQVATEESPLREEVLRLMIGNKLNKKQHALLEQLEGTQKSTDGIRRVLGKPFFQDRPPAKNIDAWLKRLEGKADTDAGARVFFHPKLAGCYKCHKIDGRGAAVGPDLSRIGMIDRRSILESILQPSNTVAPHYVAWRLETTAGKAMNGMLVHTHLDEYTFVDAKGERFKVRTSDLVEQRPTAQSIVPDGLVDLMTDQEVRDLLAYLESRK
jgi:putative heme-binding domain-containing protein